MDRKKYIEVHSADGNIWIRKFKSIENVEISSQ